MSSRKDLFGSCIYVPASYFAPLSLRSMFGNHHPLEVEIGSGHGSFLVQYALQCPNINLLGIERFLGRIKKLDKKARARGIENIRLLRVEASYGIKYLIPPESVFAYHIYFPDPWPKRKHWKNRLIAPTLLPSLAKTLVKNGRIYIRTDHRDYFDQMQKTFAADPRFIEIKNAPSMLMKIMTDFEKSFNGKGIPTLRAQYDFIPSKFEL